VTNSTLPELYGSTHAELAAPTFFLPDREPILTDHEMQQLEEINPADFQMLDEIKSQVTVHRQWTKNPCSTCTVTHHFKKKERTTIFISICAIFTVGILCFFSCVLTYANYVALLRSQRPLHKPLLLFFCC
jgi:hypothetical protein